MNQLHEKYFGRPNALKETSPGTSDDSQKTIVQQWFLSRSKRFGHYFFPCPFESQK